MISTFAELYRETCMRAAADDAFYRAGGVRVRRIKVASGGSVMVTIAAGGVEVHLVNEDHDPGDED